MAQVGAGIHDGVELLEGGLWLGFSARVRISVSSSLFNGLLGDQDAVAD